jgi:hypothetical protein
VKRTSALLRTGIDRVDQRVRSSLQRAGMNLRHGDRGFPRDILAVNLCFIKAKLIRSSYSMEQKLYQLQGSAYSPAIQPIALVLLSGYREEEMKKVQSL